jgi:hypothetical protein
MGKRTAASESRSTKRQKHAQVGAAQRSAIELLQFRSLEAAEPRLSKALDDLQAFQKKRMAADDGVKTARVKALLVAIMVASIASMGAAGLKQPQVSAGQWHCTAGA